jgi:hypothetical protein
MGYFLDRCERRLPSSISAANDFVARYYGFSKRSDPFGSFVPITDRIDSVSISTRKSSALAKFRSGRDEVDFNSLHLREFFLTSRLNAVAAHEVTHYYMNGTSLQGMGYSHSIDMSKVDEKGRAIMAAAEGLCELSYHEYWRQEATKFDKAMAVIYKICQLTLAVPFAATLVVAAIPTMFLAKLIMPKTLKRFCDWADKKLGDKFNPYKEGYKFAKAIADRYGPEEAFWFIVRNPPTALWQISDPLRYVEHVRFRYC